MEGQNISLALRLALEFTDPFTLQKIYKDLSLPEKQTGSLFGQLIVLSSDAGWYLNAMASLP